MMVSAENIRKFSFETGFDPGMLLDKPGRRMPEGPRRRVRGGAPAALSPPHGARGSAPRPAIEAC